MHWGEFYVNLSCHFSCNAVAVFYRMKIDILYNAEFFTFLFWIYSNRWCRGHCANLIANILTLLRIGPTFEYLFFAKPNSFSTLPRKACFAALTFIAIVFVAFMAAYSVPFNANIGSLMSYFFFCNSFPTFPCTAWPTSFAWIFILSWASMTLPCCIPHRLCNFSGSCYSTADSPWVTCCTLFGWRIIDESGLPTLPG